MSSYLDPKPYHLLAYGALLGSNLFQTFLAGPLAFKALPRPQFSTLQQAIFPPYFTVQTFLPIVLALSWPGERIAGLGSEIVVRDVGVSGLWKSFNGQPQTGVIVPIGLMFLTSAVNLVWLGPATTKVMKLRKHQETRDGKKYFDPGPKSPEMTRLNKEFGYLHGASSLSNVIGLGAMIAYAFTLAAKL